MSFPHTKRPLAALWLAAALASAAAATGTGIGDDPAPRQDATGGGSPGGSAQEPAPDPLTDPAPRDPGSPAVDVDRTEAVASAVGQVVQRLSRTWAETGDPLGGEDAGELFAPDASAIDPPAPAEWSDLRFAAGAAAPVTASVRPAPGFDERPAVVPGEGGAEEARLELRDAFRALGESIGGAPTRPLELATKLVTPVPDAAGETYDVRIRVRGVRSAAGEPARLARAVWLTRWRVGDADAVQLVAFDQRIFERAAARDTAPGRPWFADVTASALDQPALVAARASIHALRDRLDVDVGVGILGHHGVTVADINGDGIDDLFLPQPGGVPNQLWVREADGTALELAGLAGLDHLDATTSAMFLDLDGDGDRDGVLALADGLQVMTQTMQGFTPGPFIERGSMTGLAAADVDDDGRIDLYACAYADPYRGLAFPLPYHDAQNGQANVLLMNRTDEADALRFVDETDARGLGDGARRFSFAAAFEDADGDGDVDLYVANDFGRNSFHVNDGEGRFTEAAAALGVEDIAAGMGAAFDDIDGDGHVDLYVTNMESSAGRRVTGREGFRPDLSGDARALFRRHAKGNTLFLGRPDGTFEEAVGVAAQARWAWGGIPFDLDGDGFLDLFSPNGFVSPRRRGKPDL